jgi:DNA-directed RNA polymerase I, II, and III subunit RPABC5
MSIPIKCFTCGNVLANKYRYYQEEVTKLKVEKGKSLPELERSDIFQMTYMNKNNIQKTPEGIVLDKIGLKNVCCRRHMLTHVDIE